MTLDEALDIIVCNSPEELEALRVIKDEIDSLRYELIDLQNRMDD
jgi:hypothetical protein